MADRYSSEADAAAFERSGGQTNRRTWQKKAVLDALTTCADFVSAQRLHRMMEDAGTAIGLSTVYRQLNALADSGRADTIRLDGRQMFRICTDDDHHHHLVCERCGRTVEIEPPDEQWVRAVAARYGFTVTSHTVEVFGLCPDCARIVSTASA